MLVGIGVSACHGLSTLDYLVAAANHRSSVGLSKHSRVVILLVLLSLMSTMFLIAFLKTILCYRLSYRQKRVVTAGTTLAPDAPGAGPLATIHDVDVHMHDP